MVDGRARAEPIRTPDRRLRVFVSSTLGELSRERAAVKTAVEQLRLSPIMFEMGARPHPPRALYRSYLEQSDVFVGVYWQRYGWVAPDMEVSGLEDEFVLSEGMPRLLYVKRPAPDIEPRLADMLRGLRAGDAESYKPFTTVDELRELVLDDLALLLTERFGAAVSAERAAAQPVHAPEPTTRLVGRDHDIAELVALLGAHNRLVTLTGVGGVGKTRLASAVLARLRDSATVKTAFVDLAAIEDPGKVLDAVTVATGTRQEGSETALEALARRLANDRWLVLLDNFEQVVAAAPDVAALLQRCGGLRILVTSRLLLRLRGEVEYPVGPLPVERRDGEPSAVALFLERARTARSNLRLDETNHKVVEEICRRLDGLPLALELAAPQLRLFSVEQLLERLDIWLEGQAASAAYADLPARQRTLRATVDWSWGLLGDSARALFARLAIFNGAFTIDAATEVCGWDGLDVVTALATLLDHSLVSPTSRPDGQPAFRMLDTIRTQARAHLLERTEEDSAFAALEAYLVKTCDAASHQLHTAAQPQVLRELDGHLPDIAATLGWLLERDRRLAPLLRTIAACWVWAQVRGYLRRLPEISARMDDIALHEDDVPVICWLHMGRLMTSCRFDEVARFVESRLPELSRLEAPMYGMALVVRSLSIGTAEGEPVAAARSGLEEAVSVLEGSGHRPSTGYGLSHLGDALLLDRDLDGARVTYGKALRIAHDLGDLNLAAENEYHLAVLCLEEGNAGEAGAHLRTAAPYYMELIHLDGIGRCLAVAAGIASADARPDEAARLLGTAAGLREPTELVPWPMIGLLERRWSARVRELLGDEDFTAEYEAGRGRDGTAELVASLALQT